MEFDGHVAALIVCPEMSLPSEWLPPIWGGDGAFEDIEEAKEIIGEVMGNFSRVAPGVGGGS